MTLSRTAPERAKAAPTEGAGAILYVPSSLRGRASVRERVARLGAPVAIAGDVADGIRMLSTRRFSLALVDLADDRGALGALRLLRGAQPGLALAAVIDPAHPEAGAEAVQSGIVELLPWPFEESHVMAALANARERAAHDPRAGIPTAAAGVFAASPAMRQVLDMARAAAATRRGLLISGESGTGRTIVARAIHELGGGAGAFVRVDCATPPRDLEPTLFGAPAEEARDSVDRVSAESALYRANGGTLLLTNLAEAPARIQTRLAHVLRDREAIVGDGRTVIALDIRVIAVVDPDMEAAVADGRVRRDLIDRLSGPTIDVPPLSRRREDVPLLAVHFMRRAAEERGTTPKSFSRAALAVLSALPWHGNARELRELIERFAAGPSRAVVQLEDVLDHVRLDGLSSRIDPGTTLRDAKARFERECISAVLIRHHGRVGEAAKALGIQRTNLYRKVRQLNVSRSLLSARR